jgi:hypothetical protein
MCLRAVFNELHEAAQALADIFQDPGRDVLQNSSVCTSMMNSNCPPEQNHANLYVRWVGLRSRKELRMVAQPGPEIHYVARNVILPSVCVW